MRAVLLSREQVEQDPPFPPHRAPLSGASALTTGSQATGTATAGGGTVRDTSLGSEPQLPERGRELGWEVKGLALSSRVCRLEQSTAACPSVDGPGDKTPLGSTSLTSEWCVPNCYRSAGRRRANTRKYIAFQQPLFSTFLKYRPRGVGGGSALAWLPVWDPEKAGAGLAL